jgi:hypothetical protein
MDNASLRVVGIYESEQAARDAAAAARAAGAPPEEIHVGEPLDRIASVQGEMRAEMDHTVAGPGNVGPFTKEMQKGMTFGVVLFGAIGLMIALPFALIEFGGWSWPTRLWIVALVGLLVGATAGWVIGGGFGALRPEEQLAGERGVPVSAPASEPIVNALVRPQMIRLDLVDRAGVPVETIATEDTPSISHEIGKHMANEDRDS